MSCELGAVRLNPGWALGGGPSSTASDGQQANAPRRVYHCPSTPACKPGPLALMDVCANGTAGKFCAACARDYYRHHQVAPCVPCAGSSMRGSQFDAVTAAWLVGGALLLLAAATHKHTADLIDGALIKIVLGYFQVMTALGTVLDLHYEEILPWFASVLQLAGALRFNLADVFRRTVHCSLDFYSRFFANVLGVPLVLLALVLLKYACYDRPRHGAATALNTRRVSCFFVVFCLYPSTAHKLFRVFNCRTFGPHEAGWLEASDYTVDCGSAQYQQLRIVTAILILLIPIGMPALFLVLLRRRWVWLSEFQQLTVGDTLPSSGERTPESRRGVELKPDMAHRAWPWAERFPPAAGVWTTMPEPSCIAHIAARGVSAVFLRAFTESKCCRNQTTRSVHSDIVLSETRGDHSRYVKRLCGLADAGGRPLVGSATYFVSHCWDSPWDSLVGAAPA